MLEKPAGAEKPRGFLAYFARFDLALVLDLCSRTGISRDDARLADLLAFITTGLQGEIGLWEYCEQPQVARWLTLDLLRSISCLETESGWIGSEPHSPFRPYPKRDRG